MRVEQWFFADAVAGEKQLLSSFVPNRERKHPAQVFWTVCAELIVSVNDGFGVAVGVKGMAQFFQLRPQFEIVVDLAVENDPRAAVLVVNRLRSAFEIDDCEAAHSETDGAVEVEAIVVGTTMTNRIAHSRQQLLVNRLSVVSNDTYNSTHQVTYISQPSLGCPKPRKLLPGQAC